MKQSELEECRERLSEHLAAVLYPSCERFQQRKWGSVYVRGLLLDGGRKSAGAMAERLPDGNEQSLQQFISQSTWDYTAVRQRLAKRMISYLPKQGQILFDDTGFLKSGTHSVGVARQYTGALHGVGNCQIGVSMHYATALGSVPLDFALYLPESWTNDPARCRTAGIPLGVKFQTKPQLGLSMLERSRLSGVLDSADVTIGADAGYGKIVAFRDALTAAGWVYIVGVDCVTHVWLPPVPAKKRENKSGLGRPTCRYDYDSEPLSTLKLAQQLPADHWKQVTWAEGTKKSLTSRFAAVRVHPAFDWHEGLGPRPAEWLLVEWPEGEQKPTRYWLSTLAEEAPLEDLVVQAKWRWHIEQDYQHLKDELGLDHFEGRSWVGWHRHVTMTMIAHAFLVVERLQGLKKGLYPTR
jgi:SRSO17 transposase